MVRSGTQEEKEILFKSMLEFCAREEVPSTKRGHSFGDKETVVEQAIRICNNVKNRQTRAQDAALILLEELIDKNNMLDHKCLLFLLEPNSIEPNIAGLAANKLMGRYQRPCCILSLTADNQYKGSARGYANIDFRSICEEFEGCTMAQGHAGAFGLGITAESATKFQAYLDEKLININSEVIYQVDYVYTKGTIDGQAILTIAGLDKLWGKDIEEPLIAVEGLQVTKNMVSLMGKDTNPTLKISITPEISMIKFGSSLEEFKQFDTTGSVTINAVGKCSINSYNGQISPQILITDYEIVNKTAWSF